MSPHNYLNLLIHTQSYQFHFSILPRPLNHLKFNKEDWLYLELFIGIGSKITQMYIM